MPGTNLTHAEAIARSAVLEVQSYQVELDLTGRDETFGSTTVVRFSAVPGAASFADLIASEVISITLNGHALDPASAYRDSRIELLALEATNELRVVARCTYMNTGEGLHRAIDPVDGRVYLYTHFEVPDARRVYVTFEQPDLKARFAVTVRAPSGWTVLSNSATPAPEPAGDGVATWRFAPTPRISTYLTAVMAGEYHMIHDTYQAKSGQLIPLGLACRASMAPHLRDEAEELFEVTKQGFDYYLDVFEQPYPFDKYDQVFVPEYNIGAMENVGCVTIHEELLFRSRVTQARRHYRAETVLHELAHMWFGDLVTMAWWDDLWLKESFATYISVRALAEATAFTDAWTEEAARGKAWGYRQDLLPSSHPIVATIGDLDEVAVNFDGITYAKGAAVIKQLVAWVGREPFDSGIRAYFARHAWGTTTLNDLLAALSAASGRDLAAWSRLWLQSAGPNTLRPMVALAHDGRYAHVAIDQEALAQHPTLRPHRIAIGCYRRGPQGLHRTAQYELDVSGPRTEVPQLAGQSVPDLLLLNDDDHTYARVRFDPRSQHTVLSGLADLADPLARAICVVGVWDMVRGGELAATEYVTMARTALGPEANLSLRESMQDHLVTAVQSYLEPPAATTARAQITGLAAIHLATAAAGSDAQLLWARLLARLATQAEHLQVLGRILDGSSVPTGLTVDADLRWALIAALARTGHAGLDAIEAELDRDRTTTGLQCAAAARAARPDAAAKAEAWASLIDRDDLTNELQRAVIGGPFSRIGAGMIQPEQTELLRPYATAYFQALPRIWASRTFEIAGNIATGLYPWYLIEQSTVDQTDTFLGAADPPAALRRLVVECRDEVVRALAARAVDRAATA